MPSSRNHSSTARASLVFSPTGQPKGFATLATTQWDGSPEPVVRELLQNSLDACVKAGRTHCEVSFIVRDVPLNGIPGIEEYREHFHAAVLERRKGHQGHAEKDIITRIERVLQSDRMRVLMCRDNGVGLTSVTMSRLLTEGNTDKSEVGAGAFGVGHLTAFAASDTRYVLYGGRNNDERTGTNDVASAQALLASRPAPESADFVQGLGLAAEGFWLVSNEGPGAPQLGLFDPKYPSRAPDLLQAELDELGGTGTVICLTGFNDFRSDNEDPADAIARVSSKNFLVAIQRRRMTVEIRDETTDPVRRIVVNDAGLRTLLRKERLQKRTRRGWLPGEQAYRCLRTLEKGEPLLLACGAKAVVRRLDPSESVVSCVQIFRNGMWITNRADELTSPRFVGVHPFDAVITIGDGQSDHPDGDDREIAALVRGAEGPEHRGLDRKRLAQKGRRQRLLDLLREIKSELQEWAGKVAHTKDYTPPNFAVFAGRGAQLAEKVAPYRPRRIPDSEDDSSEATTPQPSDDDDAKAIDPLGTGSGYRGRGAKPKPGKTVSGRSSVVPLPNGDGRIDTLQVLWQPPPSRRNAKGKLGVRVRIPSGSDETCELPLGPKWLPIREICTEDGEVIAPADGYEATLPYGDVEFTLTLLEPISDATVVEVDFVRRTSPGAKQSQDDKN